VKHEMDSWTDAEIFEWIADTAEGSGVLPGVKTSLGLCSTLDHMTYDGLIPHDRKYDLYYTMVRFKRTESPRVDLDGYWWATALVPPRVKFCRRLAAHLREQR
jgi:hypothetical protein